MEFVRFADKLTEYLKNLFVRRETSKLQWIGCKFSGDSVYLFILHTTCNEISASKFLWKLSLLPILRVEVLIRQSCNQLSVRLFSSSSCLLRLTNWNSGAVPRESMNPTAQAGRSFRGVESRLFWSSVWKKEKKKKYRSAMFTGTKTKSVSQFTNWLSDVSGAKRKYRYS